jgi:hypothetical protein
MQRLMDGFGGVRMLAIFACANGKGVETTAQGLTFRVDKTTAMDNPWDCVDLFQ